MDINNETNIYIPKSSGKYTREIKCTTYFNVVRGSNGSSSENIRIAATELLYISQGGTMLWCHANTLNLFGFKVA